MNVKARHSVQPVRANVEKLPRLRPVLRLSKRPQRETLSSSSSSPFVLSCESRRLVSRTSLLNKMETKTNRKNNKCTDYSKEYTQLEFDVTKQSNRNNNNTKIATTNASNSINDEHMMTNNELDEEFNTCNNTDEKEYKHNNSSNVENADETVSNEKNNNESEELLLWLYASKSQQTSVKLEGEREEYMPLLEEEREEENEHEEQCQAPYNRSTELFDIKENQSSSVSSHLMLPRVFDATSSSIIYNRSVIQELENTLKRSTQHETRILRAAKQAVQNEQEEEMELLHKQNKQSTSDAQVTKQTNPEDVVQETLSLLAQLENRGDKLREPIIITGAKEVEAGYNYKENKNSNYETKANVCNSRNKNDDDNDENDDDDAENHKIVEMSNIAPAFANLRVEPLTVENLRRRYGECDVLYAMRHKTRNAMTTLSMPSTASLLEKESVKHLPLCSVKSYVNANKDKEIGKLFSETSATNICKVLVSNSTSNKLTNWQKQGITCDVAKLSSPREQVQFALMKKLHTQQTEKELNVDSGDKVTTNSNINQTKVKNSNVCNWSKNNNNKNNNVKGKENNNLHIYSTSKVERTELDIDRKPWWTTEKFRFHLIRQWCDRTQLLPQFSCSKNKCNAEMESQDDVAKKEVEQLDPEKAAEITMLRVLAEEIEAKTNRMLEQKRALRKDTLHSKLENENYLGEETTQNVLGPSERNAQLYTKSTRKIGITSSTNTKQNNESAIDLTSADTCNTSSDAWWTREFEPWKDVNVFDVRSAGTLHHNHYNQHKESQQQESQQQEQQEEQKAMAWNKEWYSTYLSCYECQLLEMLTITYHETFEWMNNKEQQLEQQEKQSSFDGHVDSSTNVKSKVRKKEQNEQGLHEIKLILTFASTLSDFDKTILHVDLSELLHLTPISLLDKWSKRTLTSAVTNAGDKDDDNGERVTLRAAIEKWQSNLYRLYTRAVQSGNYSSGNTNSVNYDVLSNKELQEEHTQYLCRAEFDITSFVDASVHCVTEAEREAIQLIKESEINGKLKCITASPIPTATEVELNVITKENDTVLQSPLSAHQDLTGQTRNTNGDDSVVEQDDTLLTLPHAPLHGRRRYPIDMRQLFVTASLCKEENENILFAELRKLKTAMQVTRTQLMNLCREHDREQELEWNVKPVNSNEMSLHMYEQNQKLLQRTKQEWKHICELQNTELEYVHVMHKVCENELLIVKYNSHVKAYNRFAQQEQPLWGKLYKTGLLISYALCLYLHRHGMDELPEKYFVLLPQVARFLNCVGGHREMRLRLPQLLIEINERAKKVRLHLDYVMECWAKNNNGCTCNEERECVILDAVVRAAEEIRDDQCTRNYEGSGTNNNDNNGTKKSANYVNEGANSNNLHRSANAVSRLISCLATEDDVVPACMQPLPLSSVRLEDVLHE